METIQGYVLEFASMPTQKKPPKPRVFSQTVRKALSQELVLLLQKGAIKKVEPIPGEFLSNVFTIPKKEGSLRLVVNLRPLNQFLVERKFKMEGIGMLKDLLRKDDWLVTVDLKDAYLSVPMAEVHRKFLRFVWEEQHYEFQSLPFGLASAPRVFTKLLKPVMAVLRRQGIRCIVYIDDLLLLSQSRAELHAATRAVLSLLTYLGFIINWEKSVLEPRQCLRFLGFLVDTTRLTLTLPTDKLERIQKECRDALKTQSVTVRQLSRLIGRMTATVQAVLPAPLHYRSLQLLKNRAFARTQSFETSLVISREAKDELRWWIKEVTRWNGRPVALTNPRMVIETDASLLGWGARCKGQSTGGMWTMEERRAHINLLELLGGTFAVKALAQNVRDAHIKLRMDNQSAVAYINHMGGTRSQGLSHFTRELWSWCLQRGITLSAEYLPGNQNQGADRESRTVHTSGEWKLDGRMFETLQVYFGDLKVDMFATRLNNQIETYISWKPDPFAMAVDAFQVSWREIQGGYAFPPFCLIGRCLQKLKAERATMLLLAPVWPAQHWYPTLLECLIDHPMLLCPYQDLLMNPFGQGHPLLLRRPPLQLAAWRVSGDREKQEAFQLRLPISSRRVGVQVPTQFTSQPGQDGAAGVIGERLILFQGVLNPL